MRRRRWRGDSTGVIIVAADHLGDMTSTRVGRDRDRGMVASRLATDATSVGVKGGAKVSASRCPRIHDNKHDMPDIRGMQYAYKRYA